MQANKFAENYNTPLAYLSDPVLVQVHPFGSSEFGVHLSLGMSSSGKGMYTPTSAMMDDGFSPTMVSASRPNASIAPIVPLKFSTPLSSSARVVSPSMPSNITGQYDGVVTRIPNAAYTSSPFIQNTQSAIVGPLLFLKDFRGMEDTFLYPHLT